MSDEPSVDQALRAVDLLAPALAGICLHRLFLMGLPPDQDIIRRVVDQIILPAALKDPTREN